jgi:hypothetical protein
MEIGRPSKMVVTMAKLYRDLAHNTTVNTSGVWTQDRNAVLLEWLG